MEDDDWDVTVLDMNLRGMQDPRWVSETFYTNALNAIAATEPHVVGFTSMAVESHVCLEMARLLKERDCPAVVVLGGPHFSAIAEEVLSLYHWIDYVITGEGEAAMRLLGRHLRGGLGRNELLGVARREGSSVSIQNGGSASGEGNAWLFPAYHLVNLPAYFDMNPMKLLDFEAGRGCIFRCSFCYSPVHWGQGDRSRPIHRVVEDVARLRELGAAHLFFVQDNFLNSVPRAKQLCAALAEARTGMTWNCYATLPQLQPDVLDALASAGCRSVFVGVDAVTAEAKQSFKKHFFKGWVSLEGQLRACLDRGIVPTCAFMVDPPIAGSGPTDAALETALLCRNLGCGIRLNTLTLYNKTATELAAQHLPRMYTDLKPRFMLDTPAVVWDNPYARQHPELFPFHNTVLPLDTYSRFVTGMHVAYTLFRNFPRTLLNAVQVDGASLWHLADKVGGLAGDLTLLDPRERRPLERALFMREFPSLQLSCEANAAFAVEASQARSSFSSRPASTIPAPAASA